LLQGDANWSSMCKTILGQWIASTPLP
jgi:hypothetical protein